MDGDACATMVARGRNEYDLESRVWPRAWVGGERAVLGIGCGVSELPATERGEVNSDDYCNSMRTGKK